MATDIATAYRSAYMALALAQEQQHAADELDELTAELHALYLTGRDAGVFAANTAGGLPYPLPTDPVAAGADAIRALAEAVNSGATLVRRATMNVANNTAVAIQWSGALNTPNVGDSVPGTTNGVTIGKPGVFLIHAVAHWDANATGTRQLQLLDNGAVITDDIADIKVSAGASTRTINDVIRAVRLVAGDVVNAQVTQTSGVTLGMLWARLHVYRIA